jgi:hypothetical protein
VTNPRRLAVRGRRHQPDAPLRPTKLWIAIRKTG